VCYYLLCCCVVVAVVVWSFFVGWFCVTQAPLATHIIYNTFHRLFKNNQLKRQKGQISQNFRRYEVVSQLQTIIESLRLLRTLLPNTKTKLSSPAKENNFIDKANKIISFLRRVKYLKFGKINLKVWLTKLDPKFGQMVFYQTCFYQT
jgi:hypothetical protein